MHRKWPKTILTFTGIFIVAILIRLFCIEIYSIPNGSMEDSLLSGDKVLVNKLAYGPILLVFNINSTGQKTYYRFRGEIIGENPDLAAFDGDMLTYNNEKWVGLDLGKPQRITRARVAPRNAHNGIVPGDRYELLYRDGQWVSAGIREARYHFIEFDEVPRGTLYWLKNLDHGKEEQPFYCTDGRQKFSNQPSWTEYGKEE